MSLALKHISELSEGAIVNENIPIIALDFPSEIEVFQFLNQFDEEIVCKSWNGAFLSRRSCIL